MAAGTAGAGLVAAGAASTGAFLVLSVATGAAGGVESAIGAASSGCVMVLAVASFLNTGPEVDTALTGSTNNIAATLRAPASATAANAGL